LDVSKKEHMFGMLKDAPHGSVFFDACAAAISDSKTGKTSTCGNAKWAGKGKADGNNRAGKL
jgi:hypothetical protein